jgi:hypothetical protein
MIFQVPLETTVRNKVFNGNILVGTLFIKVISRETYYIENQSLEKKAPS